MDLKSNYIGSPPSEPVVLDMDLVFQLPPTRAANPLEISYRDKITNGDSVCGLWQEDHYNLNDGKVKDL